MIAANETQAGRIKDDLSFLFCSGVYNFPSREYMFYDADAANHGGEYARIKALHRMDSANAIVTTVKAMLQYPKPPQLLNRYNFGVQCGDILDGEQFCADLSTAGYKRVSTVEGMGQYSRRGSIVDVFCPLGKNPVRIEFFDDEVDSLREFDRESQVSIKNVDSFTIVPARELIYDRDSLDTAVEKINALKN